MHARFAAALAAAYFVTSPTPASAEHPHAAPPSMASPDTVLKELAAGNARFVKGKLRLSTVTPARRVETAKGQHPKAIVLGCADSRVPPELIFDQGIGDLFVVRVAGNVAAEDVLGSIEYAAEHLGAQLVVVLAHTQCGAVKATCAGGHVGGNLESIVHAIEPAVQTLRGSGPEACVKQGVVENARLSATAMTKKSPVLAKLAEEGKLKVAIAVYDIATGAVAFEK